VGYVFSLSISVSHLNVLGLSLDHAADVEISSRVAMKESNES